MKNPWSKFLEWRLQRRHRRATAIIRKTAAEIGYDLSDLSDEKLVALSAALSNHIAEPGIRAEKAVQDLRQLLEVWKRGGE